MFSPISPYFFPPSGVFLCVFVLLCVFGLTSDRSIEVERGRDKRSDRETCQFSVLPRNGIKMQLYMSVDLILVSRRISLLNYSYKRVLLVCSLSLVFVCWSLLCVCGSSMCVIVLFGCVCESWCLLFVVSSSLVVNVYVPKDRITGEHQGFGFVEFKHEEDADYCVKILNMIKLYGRQLRVNKVMRFLLLLAPACVFFPFVSDFFFPYLNDPYGFNEADVYVFLISFRYLVIARQKASRCGCKSFYWWVGS